MDFDCASSSSAADASPRRRYDVFLSFRGRDTRKGFVSFLFQALVRNQVDTFIDNDLERGAVISPSLLRIIEESHVSVVVFSTNYADSEWCLEELAKIHDCMKTAGQMVLPVFYQVDPTDVQELTGSYGRAMASHEQKFDKGLVESWRRALQEISSISGRASQDTESEAKLIDDIVSDVWKKLELLPSVDFNDGFVGLDSCVKEVELLLRTRDVNSVGIWGMGGIGKTAIAEKLFNKLCSDFEDQCFLNVREELENCTLVGLRNKVLSKLFKVQDQTIGTPSTLSMPVKRKLQKKKVLIVLDDVNSHGQLETLAKHCQSCGPGTKMIITSRDRQVLKKGCDEIYEVKRLSYRQAFQLFKWHAFGQIHCKKPLMDLSKRVVRYADGIPLALKVLASKLHNKGTEEWESMLAKLANVPDKEIAEVLKRSYDQLEEDEKIIFLDITCFFIGEEMDHVQRFLDACGFYANSGIKSLEDKCLIKISRKKLVMHNMVRQMGLDIIRQECLQEHGKRKRLWDPKDIYHVMLKRRVSKKVEGIALDMSRIQDVVVTSTFFSGMHNLRLLHFYDSSPGKLKLRFPNGLEFLPDELRLLIWHQYPLKCLPSTFYPANLVELCMPHSQLEQLWDMDQYLMNLKIIDLSDSKELIRIPDLSIVPDLEFLILKGCIKLDKIPSSIGSLRKLTSLTLEGCISLEVLPSSIGHLRKLSYLILGDCKNLCSFPCCLELTNLTVLSLNHCSKLTEFPEVPLNIEVLNLGGTGISKVPSSIGHLSRLFKLDLSYCTRLENLPGTIGNLEDLQQLNLEGCSKLAEFQDCFCNLKSLESLHVTCQDPDRLAENIGKLDSLKHLCIADSDMREMPFSLSHFSKLESVRLWRCKGLILSPFRGFGNLKVLQIKCCGILEIPHSLGSLVSLEELELSEENLESIPSSIKLLPKLFKLSDSGCKRLQSLPELQFGLKVLDMCNCTTLRLAPGLVTEFCSEYGIGHGDFMFGNCFNLNGNERGKIIDGVQHRTQTLTTWLFSEGYEEMESDEEQKSKSRYPMGKLMLCIPENKVPKWFDYQNIGSSLTVRSSNLKVWDIRWLAFCAVLMCDGHYDSRKFNIKCDCHLITKYGNHLDLDSYYRSPFIVDDYNSRWEPNFLHSRHLFLWYHSDVFNAPECYFVEAQFEFYPVDWEGKPILDCEVMSCGVIDMGQSCGIGLFSDHGEQDEHCEESSLT